MRPERLNAFTVIELLVAIIFAIMLVATITIMVFVVRGCNHVVEYGVQGTIERVWEGDEHTIQEKKNHE